jgi:hypothetical protein
VSVRYEADCEHPAVALLLLAGPTVEDAAEPARHSAAAIAAAVAELGQTTLARPADMPVL